MTLLSALKPAAVLGVLLLAACGGEDGRPDDPGPGEQPAALTPFTRALPGDTTRGVLPLPRGVLLFREPIGGGLVETDVRRALTWVDAAGAPVAEVRAGETELFLDVATHPSGEATLFLRAGDTCALRRYGADGALLGTQVVADTDLPTDPLFTGWDPDASWAPGACQPLSIRETARVAADGEAVYLVNRGGSHGVVLFRFAWEGGAFTRTLRQPVFPRHGAPRPTIIMASHRVLRATHWSFVPRLVVDDAGQARVVLTLGSGAAHEVFNATYPQAPVPDDARVAVLTVTRTGELRGVRHVERGDARAQAASILDVEGVRWLRGGLVLVGRTASAPAPADGLGWDGFLLHLVDGEAAPRARLVVDVDRGDVLSDVAAHGEAGWLVAGRSGYWQNPGGASISEEARAELLVLDGAGAVVRRLELPQGPRHNAALSVVPSGSGAGVYDVGGLSNGAGSHSADSDPALLQADGWVVRLAVE